jgi:hypothetical protein
MIGSTAVIGPSSTICCPSTQWNEKIEVDWLSLFGLFALAAYDTEVIFQLNG